MSYHIELWTVSTTYSQHRDPIQASGEAAGTDGVVTNSSAPKFVFLDKIKAYF